MIRLWLILNAVDLVTSLLALELRYIEGNPIANLVVSSLGVDGLIVYKVCLALLVLMFLIRLERLHLLGWLCSVMGLVVAWNLIWIIKGS